MDIDWNEGTEREKRTIVEEGTHFKGTLASSCPIDVRGRIEGEVETPSLTVSPSGAVHGRAKVGSVRSEGELSGEFDADRVELAGVVKDNTVIRARSMEVKLSSARGKMQVIFGECELDVGDEPTEEDRVDDSPQIEELSAAAKGDDPPAEQPALAEGQSTDADAETDDGGDDAEDAEDGEEDDVSEQSVATADAADGSGKRRRKRRKNTAGNGATEESTGWSSPPKNNAYSEPPPAMS